MTSNTDSTTGNESTVQCQDSTENEVEGVCDKDRGSIKLSVVSVIHRSRMKLVLALRAAMMQHSRMKLVPALTAVMSLSRGKFSVNKI